ncbi:uncharacterized protein LOC127392194 [Apus apus]|uniref:uncharacterized protein LOC127392194 n=1 Tax=Apus apus TaxID=8895 RepID=UPI0021F8640F|nr:uncharacterized protein LOC127392194 [Apus apus]
MQTSEYIFSAKLITDSAQGTRILLNAPGHQLHAAKIEALQRRDPRVCQTRLRVRAEGLGSRFLRSPAMVNPSASEGAAAGPHRAARPSSEEQVGPWWDMPEPEKQRGTCWLVRGHCRAALQEVQLQKPPSYKLCHHYEEPNLQLPASFLLKGCEQSFLSAAANPAEHKWLNTGELMLLPGFGTRLPPVAVPGLPLEALQAALGPAACL